MPSRNNRLAIENFRKHFPILPFILSLFRESCRLLKVATIRRLAPLRRVVTRVAKVYSYHRTGTPWQFVVMASLDCGHSFVEYGWSLLDLLNAYTENPEVLTRRHRCHECREAVIKKPVASVTLKVAERVA